MQESPKKQHGLSFDDSSSVKIIEDDDVKEEDIIASLACAPSEGLQLSSETLARVIAHWKRKWLCEQTDPREALKEAAHKFSDCTVDESEAKSHLRIADLLEDGSLESHHIETAYKKELFVWVQLMYQFRSQNLLDSEDSGLDIQQTFKRIAESILSSRWLLHSTLRFLKAANPSIDAGAPSNLDPFQYMPFDPNARLTAFQELSLFVLQKLKLAGYRRFRGTCWQIIMSHESFEINKKWQRVPTLAWEPVKNIDTRASLDLKDFVQLVVKKEDHFKQWQNMMQGNNLSQLVSYLENANEEEFTLLKPDRHFISFRNGVLKTTTATFIPYDSTDLPRHKVSCNYIDKQFHPSWPSLQDMWVGQDKISWSQQQEFTRQEFRWAFPWEDVGQLLDEYSSPTATDDRATKKHHFGTPEFYKIFQSQLAYGKSDYWKQWHQDFSKMFTSNKKIQELSTEDGDQPKFRGNVERFWKMRETAHLFVWHYALLGRLLFKVGEKDNWQIIQFFKGAAATGKSTLLDIVKCFFREEDVDVMANKGRSGNGGLENVWDKFMWQCAEVKGDFDLPQSQFQSMVSGEVTSITRLYKSNLAVVWEAPGILAGNEFARWRDNSGSILRRVVVTNFAQMIDENKKDPLLKKKMIDEEIHKILYKCLLSYLFVTQLYDKCDIWTALPRYFTWTKTKLSAASDHFGQFLENNPDDVLDRDESYAMTLEELIRLFITWAEKEQIEKYKYKEIRAYDMERITPLLTVNTLKAEKLTAANEKTFRDMKVVIPSTAMDSISKKDFWIVKGVKKREDIAID